MPLGDEEEGEIEETWTFIGDETDPELMRKMQEMDISKGGQGRGPRVSLDGLRAVQAAEAGRLAKSGVFR